MFAYRMVASEQTFKQVVLDPFNRRLGALAAAKKQEHKTCKDLECVII